MQRRTRAMLTVAVALISLACLATCHDDAWLPSSTDGSPVSQPDAVEPAADVKPTRVAASRVHAPRKRVAGPPVPTDAAPATAAGAAAGFGDIPGGVSYFDEGAWESPGLTPPSAADTPPTGRVRILLQKDGRPFEGGHVCFYPAERYLDAKPWDGTTSSDRAYTGLPLYTPFWPGFEPVLGSADGAQQAEERARGVTGSDGIVTLDVRADVSLVPYVRYRMGGIPLVAQPRVTVPAGSETTITIEAAPMRPLSGRCVDAAGRPLAGMWVQAIAPRDERPLSRKVETSATGAFRLEVWGADPEVRVRAVVPYVAHPLGIYDTEAEVPPIPAETTLDGVVPDAGPVDVRIQAAPLVFVELTTARDEPPLAHLQIEALVFDARVGAWGRLGGPQYRRAPDTTDSRRAVVGLPAAEAARPLVLWSAGLTITAVDARGADRVAVELPRGRRVTLRGRGWRETDRLRAICSLGAPGAEFPCIWIDSVLGRSDQWSRDDAPTGAIEFQIVRDAVVAGSAFVPPGTGPAAEVWINLH